MPRNAVTSALLTVCTPHPVLHPSSENTARASLICINAYVVTQKRFTADFLTKELRVNNGEVPQYYVEGSHEAIIAPEEFQAVQEEMARRKELGRAYSDKAFHSKIICGDCGGFYGRKVWHSTDEYRSVIFQCNQKFKNENRCQTPILTEEEIKQRFLTAYNELMGNRSTVLADCELIRQTLCDTTALDTEMQQDQDEMAVVSELMQAQIKKNASVAQSQEAYALETERIENRYNAAFEHYTALEAEKEKRMLKSKELKAFIAILKRQPLLISEWDERLWITLLDNAIIQRDGSIVFRFKSGKEIIK
ncbi:MAG: recombinase zinc beta ribbon domain-containing protein [Petrimonas sp.]|nr:recombinase zinc beta ribbon domain-containing protein [Petrimonas sp.]